MLIHPIVPAWMTYVEMVIPTAFCLYWMRSLIPEQILQNLPCPIQDWFLLNWRILWSSRCSIWKTSVWKGSILISAKGCKPIGTVCWPMRSITEKCMRRMLAMMPVWRPIMKLIGANTRGMKVWLFMQWPNVWPSRFVNSWKDCPKKNGIMPYDLFLMRTESSRCLSNMELFR